jgi:hypothetical protein
MKSPARCLGRGVTLIVAGRTGLSLRSKDDDERGDVNVRGLHVEPPDSGLRAITSTANEGHELMSFAHVASLYINTS